MKNYGTSTITEVDNYNIDTFLDFRIAMSLIMPLKSNSHSISDSMLSMVKYTCFIDVRNLFSNQINPIIPLSRFSRFYYPFKAQLFGMKCVCKHQDLQMFILKFNI